MNWIKVLKWLIWVFIASALLFGGLAIVLSPEYGRITKIGARFAMLAGIIIWGTLIVVFVTKKLK